jgi:hypothetical protein
MRVSVLSVRVCVFVCVYVYVYVCVCACVRNRRTAVLPSRSVRIQSHLCRPFTCIRVSIRIASLADQLAVLFSALGGGLGRPGDSRGGL